MHHRYCISDAFHKTYSVTASSLQVLREDHSPPTPPPSAVIDHNGPTHRKVTLTSWDSFLFSCGEMNISWHSPVVYTQLWLFSQSYRLHRFRWCETRLSRLICSQTLNIPSKLSDPQLCASGDGTILYCLAVGVGWLQSQNIRGAARQK